MTEVPHEAVLPRRSPRCRAEARAAAPKPALPRGEAPRCGPGSALLAYGAVYALAQQVGVAVVARVLLDHVI